MTISNGALARLDRAVEDIKDLNRTKADKDDVDRLIAEFRSLRLTLQWFMGIVTMAVLSFAGLVVTLVS